MLPEGELRGSRVVEDPAAPLARALDIELDGYVVFEPADALLLSDGGRGLITFEAGVPVVAHDGASGRSGESGVRALATPGPTRVAVYEVAPDRLAAAHEAVADERRVPPGLPAEVIGGAPRLAERTRAAAPADRLSETTDSVAAFLQDDERIAQIRDRARAEAAQRAAEWGLTDHLEDDVEEPGGTVGVNDVGAADGPQVGVTGTVDATDDRPGRPDATDGTGTAGTSAGDADGESTDPSARRVDQPSDRPRPDGEVPDGTGPLPGVSSPAFDPAATRDPNTDPDRDPDPAGPSEAVTGVSDPDPDADADTDDTVVDEGSLPEANPEADEGPLREADGPVVDEPLDDANGPAVGGSLPEVDDPVAKDGSLPEADAEADHGLPTDADDPVVDEPLTDADDPVVDEPLTDADDPVADEPLTDADDPVVDEPLTDADDPAVDGSLLEADDPIADDGPLPDASPEADEGPLTETDGPVVDEPLPEATADRQGTGRDDLTRADGPSDAGPDAPAEATQGATDWPSPADVSLVRLADVGDDVDPALGDLDFVEGLDVEALATWDGTTEAGSHQPGTGPSVAELDRVTDLDRVADLEGTTGLDVDALASETDADAEADERADPLGWPERAAAEGDPGAKRSPGASGASGRPGWQHATGDPAGPGPTHPPGADGANRRRSDDVEFPPDPNPDADVDAATDPDDATERSEERAGMPPPPWTETGFEWCDPVARDASDADRTS